MSQLAQEKQVNLGTSARLNALSQYVLRISFSACGTLPHVTSLPLTAFEPLWHLIQQLTFNSINQLLILSQCIYSFS